MCVGYECNDSSAFACTHTTRHSERRMCACVCDAWAVSSATAQSACVCCVSAR